MFPKHVSPVSVKHTQRAKVDTERDTPTSPLALEAEADRKPNTRNRDDEPAPPHHHIQTLAVDFIQLLLLLTVRRVRTCLRMRPGKKQAMEVTGAQRRGGIWGPWDASSEVSAPPSRSNTRTSPLTSPVPAKPSPRATAMREFMSTWMFRESKTQSDATQTYHTHTHTNDSAHLSNSSM